MQKRVIWLTGSMSSGKSTQRRNLCNEFADAEMQEVTGTTKRGLNYHFTHFGTISCLGKVKQVANGGASSCDGLDSVFGKLKKDGAIYTVHAALKHSKIVVIEGSQTSPSWAELLQNTLKMHKAELYLIHLHLTYWDNFQRLLERQQSKGKEEDTLTDKNIESLIGKCRQFNNCYDKVEGLCKRLRIDATLPEAKIFNKMVKFVFADLLD